MLTNTQQHDHTYLLNLFIAFWFDHNEMNKLMNISLVQLNVYQKYTEIKRWTRRNII